MPRTIVIPPPVFDPTKTYEVIARNRVFSGDTNGCRFVDGTARVMPYDEDMEDIDEWEQRLMWFVNAQAVYTRYAELEDGKKDWNEGKGPPYRVVEFVRQPSGRRARQDDEDLMVPAGGPLRAPKSA